MSVPSLCWTQERLEMLDRIYPVVSPQEAAEAIGLSLAKVYKKAHERGLKSARPPGRQAAPKIAESKPCLPPSKPARAVPRGPGYQPGEPIRTERTIVTVYARKPDPHRTQTFSQFGG